MAWENLDNNACPLLFFLGLFFHRNRSTCRRVRHPWLLDWTVGTRYQKNWETRLFFFRNIFSQKVPCRIWIRNRWLAGWDVWSMALGLDLGKLGHYMPPLVIFFWIYFFTVTVRRYHVESQSHMVRSQTRSRVRHRSVAPGLDSKKSKMHIFFPACWTCETCTLQSKTRLPVGKNLEQKHYLNLGKK